MPYFKLKIFSQIILMYVHYKLHFTLTSISDPINTKFVYFTLIKKKKSGIGLWEIYI